jgi:hypothetical protein
MATVQSTVWWTRGRVSARLMWRDQGRRRRRRRRARLRCRIGGLRWRRARPQASVTEWAGSPDWSRPRRFRGRRRRETPACVGSERCCRLDPVPGSCHSIRCRNRSSWSVQAPPCGPLSRRTRSPECPDGRSLHQPKRHQRFHRPKRPRKPQPRGTLCESLPQPFGATPCCPAGMLGQWIVRRHGNSRNRDCQRVTVRDPSRKWGRPPSLLISPTRSHDRCS